MAIVIESNRFHFRFVAERDLLEIFRLQSDEEIMRYIRPADTTIDTVRARMDNWLDYAKRCPGFGVFVFEWKTDGRFAGYAVARHVDFDESSTEFEVGYAVDKAFWGQGIASEIVGPLCNYLLQYTTEANIIAFTDPDNLPSQQVLLKNGFKKDGTRIIEGGECIVFRLG
jgi:[ribosomal protein S5]-alanine N-acetyltransferase